MLTETLIVSYTLCFFSLIYVLISFYGLSLDYKNRLNKIFFLMSFSLSVWALTYSISIISESLEMALLYNKISALGWGSFYSFVLHLTKILISGEEKLSKKYYTFIYSPAILFILGFMFIASESSEFVIIKSSYGYVATTPFTGLNILFGIYALSFSLLAIRNIAIWYKKNKIKKSEKLIKTTIVLFCIALLLGFVSDIIWIRVFEIHFIQMTIFWLFIPVIFMFYVLLKTRTIKPVFKPFSAEIIDSDSKKKILHVVGYIYIVISYLNLLFNHITYNRHDNNSHIFSLVIFLIGVSHFFLTNIFKRQMIQNLILTLIYILSLLFMAFNNFQNLSITIWSLLFCFIVVVSMFQKRAYSYIAVFTILLTQLFYWHLIPRSYIYFDWKYYLFRTIILLIFSCLIFYLNNIYRKNANSNIRHIEKQRTMNKISEKIIDIDIKNLSNGIYDFLLLLNQGFSLKCSYYIFVNKKDNSFKMKYYRDCDNSYKNKSLDNTIFSINKDWYQKMINNEELIVFNIHKFTSKHNNCENLRQVFKERQIDGFYALPIFVNSEFRSILVFEFIENEENKLMYLYKDTITNMVKDAIKKIDSKKALFKRINFDEVTGLDNRSYFIEKANIILEKKISKSHYVIYIDIDNFKSVNDSFGHLIGDEVLRKVANILKKTSKKQNILTRISGDEFVIFCDKSYTKNEIEKYIKKILESFKDGVEIRENRFRLKLSFGISHYPEDGTNIDQLIKNADIAMSKSKKMGYIKYHFCDEKDKKSVLEDSLYTESIYYALKKDEFFLVYQPQISLEDDSIIGAEALLRWQSEKFGLVPPNKFIHILERTGLIVEVGEWIIQEAIKQQIKMSRMGLKPINISINLSVVQLLDTGFIDKINKILNKYKVDTHFIEFEITESIAINDEDDFVIDILNEIKKLGFSIAIDDFGTGYSSLKRLQKLPIDRLRIDKSFIDGIGDNDKRESIVNIVIEFAEILDLKSIAEGVEDSKQLEYLRRNDCNEVQGYHFAKPMKVAEFENFVKNYK